MDVGRAVAPLNLHYPCVCGQQLLLPTSKSNVCQHVRAKYVVSHQREIVSGAIAEV